MLTPLPLDLTPTPGSALADLIHPAINAVFLLMMVAIAAKSLVLAITATDRRGLLRGTALVEVVLAACWATAVVLMGGF